MELEFIVLLFIYNLGYLSFIKPHRQHFVLPPPLIIRGGIIRLIMFWRVSGAL